MAHIHIDETLPDIIRRRAVLFEAIVLQPTTSGFDNRQFIVQQFPRLQLSDGEKLHPVVGKNLVWIIQAASR